MNMRIAVFLLMVAVIKLGSSMGCVLENGTELPNGQSISENCTKCECRNGALDCGPDAAQDVDGHWSTWTQWSNCSKDCRTYSKTRYRICGSPEAECNGATCVGYAKETEPCPCVLENGTELSNGQSVYSENCIKCECRNGTLDCGPDAAQDVDGQWSSWTQWSNCRNYYKTRYRICGSPEAECNGATCVGYAQEMEPCQTC
ncbi:coadhesin-like [Patella vulgata]|uniref:coadhesin-like n=1 Tax=Patella vulgata TaxID=6465 RepID=UPI0024A8A3DD|nr:coadhesin-like [Patella vulgata]